MKVYKYRSIENDVFERDFETIKNDCFYSSNYNMLNDPFDIYFNEEISQLIGILKTLFSNKELNNFERQFKKTLNIKKEIGVYCLSKDFLNEQLWAYYASSYSGYCIEYDLNRLMDKSQNADFENKFDVNYEDKIPTIDIGDINNAESFIKKMVAVKKSTWKHEDEVRLIFNKYGLKKIHPSAITGIYFGYKTDKIIKEAFYNLFENRDVKFYEIFPSNFKLDFKLVFETTRKLKYNLSKFDFEILRSRTNQWEQVFEIFYKGDYKNEKELIEFILAFREKYCIKTNTLTLFNNVEITELIDSWSLSDDEYVRYADSIITIVYGDEVGIFNPFKDLKYEQILNK